MVAPVTVPECAYLWCSRLLHLLSYCRRCNSSHETHAVLSHVPVVAACSQLLVNTCVDLVDLLEAHQPETARGSTAASSNTNAASGSYSRSPPGDWWAVSCQQVGQLLLQVALDPCSGGSNSNSDSAASDTGSCLLQLQRLLVLEPGALPLSCCPALGCLLLALEGPQVGGEGWEWGCATGCCVCHVIGSICPSISHKTFLEECTAISSMPGSSNQFCLVPVWCVEHPLCCP